MPEQADQIQARRRALDYRHPPNGASTANRKCRVCGCTEQRACPGGCHWIHEDLCSSCFEEIEKGTSAA